MGYIELQNAKATEYMISNKSYIYIYPKNP